YLTGDIMKYVKNIFLILVFALSATAFSTSAMAASETKAPPKSMISRNLIFPKCLSGVRNC
ncbi:hypothetical protein DRB41_25090, partial [Salmonella enterica]|nr:hypothetical protein [Salmonella enterica]